MSGLDVAGAASFLESALAHEAVLTNLGKLEFGSSFGPIKLQSLWGPATQTGLEGAQVVGAATVDGLLTLTHTSHTPLPGLPEVMRSILVDACR